MRTRIIIYVNRNMHCEIKFFCKFIHKANFIRDETSDNIYYILYLFAAIIINHLVTTFPKQQTIHIRFQETYSVFSSRCPWLVYLTRSGSWQTRY